MPFNKEHNQGRSWYFKTSFIQYFNYPDNYPDKSYWWVAAVKTFAKNLYHSILKHTFTGVIFRHLSCNFPPEHLVDNFQYAIPKAYIQQCPSHTWTGASVDTQVGKRVALSWSSRQTGPQAVRRRPGIGAHIVLTGVTTTNIGIL